MVRIGGSDTERDQGEKGVGDDRARQAEIVQAVPRNLDLALGRLEYRRELEIARIRPEWRLAPVPEDHPVSGLRRVHAGTLELQRARHLVDRQPLRLLVVAALGELFL